MRVGKILRSRLSVVAIPARNEAGHIAGCLAALALQRDESGTPLSRDDFEVIVFANNCDDGTASIARRFSQFMPVSVIEENMPSIQLNAGWARKRAMDLAAARLLHAAPITGLILTTDADSRVSPTWLAATLQEFNQGVDCVAGYVDGIPSELVALGPTFLARGRSEDTYLSCLSEISARCDPRPHDPWPNHRVSSGASLAVTLAAYTAIGGLPSRPVGEDAALTQTLDRTGFRVRHSMNVYVATSCRFDGRAEGGAAETMRYRHAVPDAFCDDDIEPALHATRRALYKGVLRNHWAYGRINRWPNRLNLPDTIAMLFDGQRSCAFEDAWQVASEISPILQRGHPLRPSDLPRQITIAKMILQQLRTPVRRPIIARGDRCYREEPSEPVMSA